MSIRCQVQVSLNNITKQKSESVKKALEPDNIDFPKGLSMKVENQKDKLVFNFQSDDSMKKLIGTVDEVLSHIQVALKVID